MAKPKLCEIIAVVSGKNGRYRHKETLRLFIEETGKIVTVDNIRKIVVRDYWKHI